MKGRLVWIAVLAALGVVTTFAQLDRSSRFSPGLAPLVPAMFRGFAQQKLTEYALLSHDDEQALRLARGLVRVRPLPAENLSLLSQAAVRAGDADLAYAALEAAGGRGWREPASQLAMAHAALLVENWDGASQRIVALIAVGKLERELIDPLLLALTSHEGGRAAMSRRLAEQGHWQANFVPLAANRMPPQDYADMLERALALDAPLDCSGLGRAAAALQQAGEHAAAARFWPGDCPGN